MRIIAALLALVLLASPARAAYRVLGYVTYQGQRVLVVDKIPQPKRKVVQYGTQPRLVIQYANPR